MTQAEDQWSLARGEAVPARTEESGRTLPASLEETARLARGYFEAARAENTVSAYDSDLRDFATWCRVEAGGLSPLPAAYETVALYITDLAAGRGLKASTIRRRLAAISQLHKEAGHPSPAAHEHVKDVLRASPGGTAASRRGRTLY